MTERRGIWDWERFWFPSTSAERKMDYFVGLIEKIAQQPTWRWETHAGNFEFQPARTLKNVVHSWDKEKLTAWLRGAFATPGQPPKNYKKQRAEDALFKIAKASRKIEKTFHKGPTVKQL